MDTRIDDLRAQLKRLRSEGVRFAISEHFLFSTMALILCVLPIK